MLERFKAALHAIKESRSWPAILSLGLQGPQWTQGNYQAYAREGYAWNSTVYSCINTTVRALRGVKFGVYVAKGSGLKQVTTGPLAELIKHPNPRQSFSAIVGEWAGSMELAGNAYIEGVSLDGDSTVLTRPPKELYVLRPDRMSVIAGDIKMPIAGYQYSAGGVSVLYSAQMWRNPATGGYAPRLPVMHSKYWNPTIEDGDFYGMSPVRAAARNIDAFNSAVAWNVALTQNSARPSGVFSSDDSSLTATQAEEYTNYIRQKFSGAGNAGRPMIMGKGLKWQEMGLSPADMDWLKGLNWNANQIASIFGIPPEIIGDSEGRTYSNYEEARKSVWMEKWLCMLDMLCEDLNTWLSPLFGQSQGNEMIVGYDRDAIEAIQEDRQLKWKNAKDGEGFLRVNEQRALLGYAPVPEGDVIMVPTTSIPLETAQQAKPLGSQLATTSGNTPKPKPQAKPAKKLDQVVSAEFVDDEPRQDAIDALLQQIADSRERLKLLG